jgi:ankyrin repeat protein
VYRSKSCGLWFQRIEELVDQQQPRASIVEPMFETTEKAGALVATRHQLPISKPKPLDKKRKLEKADFEENMNMFKRVRLFEHKHIIKHLGGLSPSEFRRREAARRLRYEPPPPGVESCQLQSACFRGSVAEVQALLQRGFDVNGIGTWSVEGPYPISSCTALEAAVEAGNLATVEHLLKHGANPYTRHVMWGMPLTSAVRQGNIELVKTMLLHGIDANPKYRCIGYHTSALQRASYDENLAMIKLLVYYGADVNASAGYFGRALEAAAVTGNSSTAEYLLDAGANVNAFNELIPSKLTALARAIFKDHRLMVRLLIARGADIRLYCEQGGKFRNAVQCAAYYGREEILDYLVDEEGADIYQSSPSYTNSLQAAVQGAQERIFHNLIGRGMDIKMPCVYSDNLLHVAASGGAFGIVEYLLDQGIDVNMEGSYYGSALIAAATAPSHRDSVCRILIDRGADLLVSHERRGFALHTAVESGCLLTVELLLDAGLPINAVGGKYATALQAAALNTPEPVVLLLLERGANINIQGGYFGNALQAWSYVGNEYIVKLLLEAGADPSARGGYYETALIAAVHEGYDNIVELLLTYGASFDAVSPNYGSALDCAESLWRDDQPESDLMKRARIKSLLTSRSSLRMKVLFP